MRENICFLFVPADTTYRLVGGCGYGRLETLVPETSTWGTVCDSSSDPEITPAYRNYVCGKLGYSNGGKDLDIKGYSTSTQPFSIKLDCDNGGEDCNNDAETDGCSHADDVAIICSGKLLCQVVDLN